MNEVLRKVVGWFKKVFTREHVVVPAPREKLVVPHGSKWRRKGRTKGAFGSCNYLRIKGKRRGPRPLMIQMKGAREMMLIARRKRRRIRKLIAAA